MGINRDFKELFSTLNTCRVRYLVAGAHAVMYHTEPRFTKDLDLWVEPIPENAKRVWAALVEFGAPLRDLTEADLCNPKMVYQIGVAPNRVDIMMGVPGIRFATAWGNRVPGEYGGVPINIMGRKDLMRAKRTAGRPQDLIDLSALKGVSAKGHRHSRRSHIRKRARQGGV